MRLFKVYDPYIIGDYIQCMGIWADNEQKALRKMASIQEELDVYEDPYDTVMDSFKTEEYFPAHDCDVYIAYPKDMSHAEDVKIVFVPHSVQNIEDYIMDELSRIESKEDYFRNYVDDTAINMSLAESFFRDENGYLFDDLMTSDGGVDVREDIKVRVLEDNLTINRYIDDCFIHNVNVFFKDNKEFRDEYLSYAFSDDDSFFSDEFYHYVAKRLMDSGDWLTYTNIQLVDIIAD